jgi:predicted dehydrogenase
MNLQTESAQPLRVTQAPLRMGVVGCGAISDYLHFPAMKLASRIAPSAAIDLDRRRAEQAAEKFDLAHACIEMSECASEIDAVVIAAPPHVKLPLVKQAIQLGLHVLCEKPLANTVAECETLAQWIETARLTLGVVHQFRFWLNRRWVYDRLNDGRLPAPKLVEVSQGAPYSWQSVTGYSVRREFVPGGVLINAGVHPLDTLLWWFGDPVHLDYWDDAWDGLESNVRMCLEFSGNVTVHYRQSRTCHLANEIRLLYDDRRLVLNNSDPFRLWERKAGSAAEEIMLTCPSGGYLAPAAAVYENFAAAVCGKEPLEVDAQEATRVIRLIETCYDQKRRRPRPRKLPLPGMTW